MTTLLAFDGDFTIRAPTSISGIMTFVTISVFLTEKKLHICIQVLNLFLNINTI